MTTNAGEDIGEKEQYSTLVGAQTVATATETSVEVSLKVETRTAL